MYERNEANDKEIVAAVEQVSKERNVSMADVAMAWVLQKDGGMDRRPT
ncbi:hypothetical protein [Mesorhizobium sp. M1348]